MRIDKEVDMKCPECEDRMQPTLLSGHDSKGYYRREAWECWPCWRLVERKIVERKPDYRDMAINIKQA